MHACVWLGVGIVDLVMRVRACVRMRLCVRACIHMYIQICRSCALGLTSQTGEWSKYLLSTHVISTHVAVAVAALEGKLIE